MTGRDIGASNVTAVESSHVEIVNLAKLEFGTPAYAHTGYGDIVWDGNTYTGVGDFAGMSNTRESEVLSPSSITLTLSGFESNLLGEALDSAHYGDVVTIYEGYRNDDGTLVQDPWVLWKGTVEYATVQRGENNSIALICSHDLAVLAEKAGDRFTDEDQVRKYANDRMFEYITRMQNVKLSWAGDTFVTFSDGTGKKKRRRRNTKKKG